MPYSLYGSPLFIESNGNAKPIFVDGSEIPFPSACEARGIEQTKYTRGEVVPSRDRSFLHHDRQRNGIYLSDCTQYRCTWTDDLPSGGCYAYPSMDGLNMCLIPLSRMALTRLINCIEKRRYNNIYGICVAFISKTSY